MQIDHTNCSCLWRVVASGMTCSGRKTTKFYCVTTNSVCAIGRVLVIFLRTKCGTDCCLKLERANFLLPYVVTLKAGVVYGPQISGYPVVSISVSSHCWQCLIPEAICFENRRKCSSNSLTLCLLYE